LTRKETLEVAAKSVNQALRADGSFPTNLYGTPKFWWFKELTDPLGNGLGFPWVWSTA